MLPNLVYVGPPPVTESSIEDSRAYARVETSLSARWQGTAAGNSVRLADFSEGGCYVDSIAKVFVGEALCLNILSDTNEWFELPCVVVHHSRLGFGVRFADLNEISRAQVRSLIEKS